VLGASADSVDLNQQFTDKNAYTFPLLCDFDKKLISALGIAGKAGFAMRVTYIVDGDGRIVKIFDKVMPKGHADEVLRAVKELKK
jgi:thioredoxin-dependent peroxiredoxin